MSPTLMSPARQHAYDAARFTELVDSASTGDWARPTPVAEWTALDVVKHLVEWSRGFLKGAAIELPAIDVEADPGVAWRLHGNDIQTILDDPAGRVLSNPYTGDKPVDQAIDQFYAADIWMHSWDLAKALGRDPDLDEERCAAALTAMEPDETDAPRQRRVRALRARRQRCDRPGQTDGFHRPRSDLAAQV